MIDFKKLQEMLLSKNVDKKYPKHTLIELHPSLLDNFSKIYDLLNHIIDIQTNKNLPIVTVSLGSSKDIDQRFFHDISKTLIKLANEKKINVTIFGKWYDLEGQLVEQLKVLNNETKEFDHFFLNLCINYNGKEEITDASRVIIRKIIQEKTDIDSINPEMYKENIYSSYLLPPELIIQPDNIIRGTFLWDSVGAKLVSLNKKVELITKADIERVIENFGSS